MTRHAHIGWGASDEELLAQIRAGSSEAFGELFDRYRVRAYRVAFVVCRDQGLAEEAVQSAFLSAWKSRASYFQQRGTVAAWLLKSVRERAIDIARSDKTRAEHLTDEPEPAGRSASASAWTEVTWRAERDRLGDLLDALPNSQQEVITLALYGGLSHTEIATQLGLSPETVKGRMRLGVHKLRAVRTDM